MDGCWDRYEGTAKELMKLKQRNADIRNLVSLLIADRDRQGQGTPG